MHIAAAASLMGCSATTALPVFYMLSLIDAVPPCTCCVAGCAQLTLAAADDVPLDLQVNALVVGTTHRYKNKYVTTVVYKPRRSHADTDGRAAGAAMAAQHQQQLQEQQQMQQHRW